jgi:hypothetical protein
VTHLFPVPEMRRFVLDCGESLAMKIATSNGRKGAYVMESDKRDSGLDEFDHVSAWILRLAVGMIVLGAVFAALDRFDLLPLPAAAVVASLS